MRRKESEIMQIDKKWSGLNYENGMPICCGDKVLLITGDIGEIVFDCGAYGVAMPNCIDYDKIQEKWTRMIGAAETVIRDAVMIILFHFGNCIGILIAKKMFCTQFQK